jgi:hypothetical protein
LSEANGSTLHVADTMPYSPRPNVRDLKGKAQKRAAQMAQSPAALAGLERLDMSLARPTSPSLSSAHASPSMRSHRSPSLMSPSTGGAPRRRRSRRKPGGPSSPASRNGGGSYDSDEGDDDLVILLHSPAMSATASTTSASTAAPPPHLQLPPSVVGLGLGIGGSSGASSEAGDDEAETEPEDEDGASEMIGPAEETTPIALPQQSPTTLMTPIVADVRIQPATPDGTEPSMAAVQGQSLLSPA